MKFIKLLTFDLRNGFLKNKLLLLMAIIFPALCCFDISYQVRLAKDSASFADYFTYLYGGMKEYIPSPTDPFMFPVIWTVLFLVLPFATLNYPLNDIQSFGQQTLLRTKGRLIWWLSKCCWNVLSCVFYHLIVIGIIVLFCLITQTELRMNIHGDILWSIFQIKEANRLSGQIELNIGLILAPILISISLNLFQMALSLFIKPVFSFLSILIIVLSSSYLLSPFMIGNYAMVVRSNVIINNGVNFTIGMIIGLFLSFISLMVGTVKFIYYDIINKE